MLLLAYIHAFAQESPSITPLIAPEPVVIYGLIKGKVTDTQTPRANNLDGAIVTIQSELLLAAEGGGITVTTDSAGNYEIGNLPSGEYVITVTRKGYDESLDYITVLAGSETFHDVRLYKTDTVMSYFWKTGPVRWPLLFCSNLLFLSIPIICVYIIYYLYKLSKSKSRVGRELMSLVGEALQNHDIAKAISVCDAVGGFAKILKAGLLRHAELSGGVAGEVVQKAIWQESIQEAMENAGDKVKKEFKFQWPLIAIAFAAIGGMALLYGLFGTFTGMIRALTVIALKGAGDPPLLAGGLSETALTSVIGLAIAIPSVNLLLVAFIIHKSLDRYLNVFISRTCRTFGEMVSTGKAIVAEAEVYAGFWRRFIAYLIDSFVLGAVSLPVSLVLTGAAITGAESKAATSVIGAGVVLSTPFILLIIHWLYYALMESSALQATLGKMAIGIAVTDLEGNKVSYGKATARFFGKIVSSLILCIGFIMAGFTKRKQALHDVMASCLVVMQK